MKVQSKVFQEQTLGGIRMDFPLSLVLSHILAIKIRYRSRLLLFPRCKMQNCRCCNVCLFDQLVPSSLSRFLFSQDARCCKDCLLVCLYVWPRCKEPILQSLFVWPVHWYTSRFLAPKMQDVDVAMMRAARVLWQEFQPLTFLTWNGWDFKQVSFSQISPQGAKNQNQKMI